MKIIEKLIGLVVLFLICISGAFVLRVYFDQQEINELTKKKLLLENEKLRIEIESLESR